MKIGFFGNGPWAHNAFLRIADSPQLDMAFCVDRFGVSDPILIDLCKKYGVPFFNDKKVNAAASVDWLRSLDLDLCVSMSFDQIFKKAVIEVPRFGIINCHAGHLPQYRGRNVLNWVLINGEPYFGITVHYVDEGIDTGDILVRERFNIMPEDTYCTLLKKSIEECPRLLMEAINSIATGSATGIPQREYNESAFYCRRRGPGDEIIDWASSSEDIINLTRALCRPGPMAQAYAGDYRLKFQSAENYVLSPDAEDRRVGAILEVFDNQIAVKTIDGAVLLMAEELEVGRVSRGVRLGACADNS